MTSLLAELTISSEKLKSIIKTKMWKWRRLGDLTTVINL